MILVQYLLFPRKPFHPDISAYCIEIGLQGAVEADIAGAYPFIKQHQCILEYILSIFICTGIVDDKIDDHWRKLLIEVPDITLLLFLQPLQDGFVRIQDHGSKAFPLIPEMGKGNRVVDKKNSGRH
jgi:hypothetical protein